MSIKYSSNVMISVCLATYNGDKFIQEQLNSILLQLHDCDEVIVSDDCSDDKTIELIRSYKDSRIKIYEGKRFGSPVFNFENALMHATGDYIFLSDQDDIWMPNKIEIMIQKLQSYDLVISDAQIVNKIRDEIAPSFFRLRNSGEGFWKNLYKNTYLGCCMAFRKEVLKYVLPFPPKIAMHDIWIGLCVELWGETKFINQPLIQYRRHENNASSASEKSSRALNYQLLYRLYLLWVIGKKKIQQLRFQL